jgi:hypothetical protein
MNLLSGDVEMEPNAHPAMFKVHHDRYLHVLQLTLDDLLGRLAEVGSTTHVLTWFKEKYHQMGSMDESMAGRGLPNSGGADDGKGAA